MSLLSSLSFYQFLDDPISGDASIEHATGEVDRFGVLANLKPLIGNARCVLDFSKDEVQSIWLESQPIETSR